MAGLFEEGKTVMESSMVKKKKKKKKKAADC
jgi:hypothetical protein